VLDLTSRSFCSACDHASALLLQLPHKLGLFASSKLGLDPCSTGPLLPVFTEAVRTLLSTAQQDCMPHVQAEIIQQLADSGLFKFLD
jgi:hypothetical protein